MDIKVREYQENAMRTLSRSFHGDKVALNETMAALLQFAFAAERLDTLKKALFYGKGLNERPAVLPELALSAQSPAWSFEEETLIHAIIGIATESGELVDALCKVLSDRKADGFATIDFVNVAEEGGDVLWYMAALAKATGCDIEKMMEINIAKLKARYPDKFTETAAIDRNITAERDILESGFQGELFVPISEN